jgi:DNA gyrase subunit A
MKLIEELKAILASKELRMQIIKDELNYILDKYGDERCSRIEYSAEDFRIEDTIPDEEVVVTISHLGYIKRTPLSEYRIQNRGGRGSRGSKSREEDFIEYIFVATNHNYMLFFTEFGKVFWMRVYEIPEGMKTSKGRAIQNLINIDRQDNVKAFISLKDIKDKDYIENNYIIMATKKGIVKKTTLEAYSRPRQNGINAITIREGDELLEARLTDGSSDIMMALRSGRAIRFPESKVRPMGRNASGVRGITMEDKDEVVGMITIADTETNVLVVSENGYGKRSSVEDYRITNRGGKGVKTINITEKTGSLIALKEVIDIDDLMIINRSGIVIRISVANMRVMGRATQGVRLIKLQDKDYIAAVTKVRRIVGDEEDENLEENMDGESTNNNDSIELNESTDTINEDKNTEEKSLDSED